MLRHSQSSSGGRRVVEGRIRGYLWAGSLAQRPRAQRKTAMQKETPRNGSARTPVLTVKNVSYYYGSKQALDDVSFEVFPGRVTALLGPNGAGKTTLFSLITRLFDAPTGRIEIVGRSAAEWGSRALEPLGVVFQQPTLDLDLTVKQNLRYFAALRGLKRKDADERMARALDALDMGERIDERVRDLNGGHRRRVEIARGHAAQPEASAAGRADHRPRRADPHGHRAAISTSLPAPTISACCGRRISSTRSSLTTICSCSTRGRIVARGTTKDVVAETGAGDLGGAFRLLIGGDTEEDIAA